MARNGKQKVLAYLRTSSAANVSGKNGKGDKDSEQRQRLAVQAFAKRLEIIAEYYDAAVSGADPIGEREGFTAMLAHIDGLSRPETWVTFRTHGAMRVTLSSACFPWGPAPVLSIQAASPLLLDDREELTRLPAALASGSPPKARAA